MQLVRISAAPQTVHDASSVSTSAYLDSDVQGVVVDFYISAPLPSWGDGSVKVGTGVTDASGIVNTVIAIDALKLASVLQNAGSIGADLPFQMGLAGSAKSLSLVAYCPSCKTGVSCALLYDASGALPEGGSVVGEGSISGVSQGQVVTATTSPQIVAPAPSGGAKNTYVLLAILVIIAVCVLLWRYNRSV
jgi:hypothetical protein